MADKIKFLDAEYSEADLSTQDTEALLKLRNLVAANLGVASIKTFKDHETAVAQTWKALQKFAESDEPSGAAEGKPAKAPKAPKEPKEAKPAKPEAAQYVKRPSRKMFAMVNIVKQHTGAEGRARRWPNYKDGMLIIDAIEGEGTLAWDIMNWANQGLMTVTEPTDAEYAERRAAWYAKHNMEDPDLQKDRLKAEREAAKAAKAEEAAKLKAEKEAAKAAKAAEAAAAKAAE